jgi:hypothetical protein
LFLLLAPLQSIFSGASHACLRHAGDVRRVATPGATKRRDECRSGDEGAAMSAPGKSPQPSVFGSSRAHDWTPERIARLSPQDIKQLRANAERLNEPELAELCGRVLKDVRSAQPAPRRKGAPRTRARKLMARTKAFESRGVWLQDPNTSWGGVRKSDGTVVMALWADAIASTDGECSYLLWAPNVDGARPWSDKAAGRERLEHCKRAAEHGRAEGLLIYGQALVGQLPEEKAHTVHGADAETVIVFAVERRGEEYWAVWGKGASQSRDKEASWPRKT